VHVLEDHADPAWSVVALTSSNNCGSVLIRQRGTISDEVHLTGALEVIQFLCRYCDISCISVNDSELSDSSVRSAQASCRLCMDLGHFTGSATTLTGYDNSHVKNYYGNHIAEKTSSLFSRN